MDEIIEMYREMHKSGRFKGGSVKQIRGAIYSLVEALGIESILDYGSGSGKILDFGAPTTRYDPAVPGIDEKPKGTFDLVLCIDVLEHLPEEEVRPTMDELFKYAKRHVYLQVSTREAKKKLPDGRNCHLTVKDEGWWRSVVGARNVPFTLRFN